MPAHNSSRYISKSIESVLSQTYINFELIVINDRSIDNTEEIIKKYAMLDDRVIFINNESSSGGAYYARNIGIKNATGRYISFLDSDDFWSPIKIASQVDAMESSGFYASHSGYVRVDEVGGYLNTVNAMGVVTYKDQLRSNRIANLTGIYDRNYVDTIMQNNIGHEDYDMWLRVLKHTPSVGVDRPLAYYRVVSKSLSSNKLRSAIWHYKILKKQLSLNCFQRYYCFYSYIYNAFLKRI